MATTRHSAKGKLLAWLKRGAGRVHIAMYRRSNGRFGGTTRGAPVLLLTTTGRRSGRLRTTPLIYWERDGAYVVSASNAADWVPAWYRNLQADPRCTVQVGARSGPAAAHLADEEESRELWAVTESLHRSFAKYPGKAGREFSMVVLQPES